MVYMHIIISFRYATEWFDNYIYSEMLTVIKCSYYQSTYKVTIVLSTIVSITWVLGAPTSLAAENLHVTFDLPRILLIACCRRESYLKKKKKPT